MRLLVQLADGRKNPVCCLDFNADTGLQAFKSAALRAVLPSAPPQHSTSPRSTSCSNFYLYHSGRVICRDVTSSSPSLQDLGFRDNDLVSLIPSLRGGGGDGGSTCAESRSCYLEMYAKKKPEKFDPKDAVFARWTNCLLSAEPLSPPCVVDKLGNLLNKEAVLKALATKSLPGALRHIRGLRDVMDITLSEIPSVSEQALVRFQCPISGLELNGNFKFFAMKCCGNVLSQRALKELKAQSACPLCHASLIPFDMLPINGTEEEVEELRKRIEEERAKAKAEKKKSGGNNGSAPTSKPSHGTVSPPSEEKGVEVKGDKGPSEPEKDEESKARRVGSFLHSKDIGAAAAGKASVDGVKNKDGEGTTGKKRAGEKHGGQAKKFKAPDHAPQGATKAVYASIFLSSRKEEFKETYSCRSLPLGRN